MISRYSLSEIVLGQASVVAGKDSIHKRRLNLFVFFAFPLVSPIVQMMLGLKLTESIVSIIVSAASIFAGLLLNLLVIVYGLAPAPDEIKNDTKTIRDLRKVIQEAFYNISYAIVVCGALVVFSLVFMTNISWVATISTILVYYLGLNLLLSIIQVLKRCHSLMEFRLTSRGEKRIADAQDAWPSNANS